MTIDEQCEILKKSKVIAVVGLSRFPYNTSRQITEYLIMAGYKIFGVNPARPEIPGIEVYTSLLQIPEKIDIVDVFRKSEDIPELVPDILTIKPHCVWLQLGIRNETAARVFSEAGLEVVQDTCIKISHSFCCY